MKEMTISQISRLLRSGWTACYNLQELMCPISGHYKAGCGANILPIYQNKDERILVLFC